MSILKEIVAQMNADEKENKKTILEIDLNEKLPEESHSRYNLGYVVIMDVYHDLELNRFFNNKARHQNFEYNTNSIMKIVLRFYGKQQSPQTVYLKAV